MSHSRIFDDYAKIMSDKGLFKTADKKDTDYNIVPDKAGPDTQVEETGWELTEIAHPDQIQVAESRLNDGIVENGVEQQKTMIDVALRNPRGVLASSLIQTLVKAANALDADQSDESIKMASEIDSILNKLADGPIDTAAKTVGYGAMGKWVLKKVWDKATGAFKTIKVPAPAAAVAESPGLAPAGFSMPSVVPAAAEAAEVGAAGVGAAEVGAAGAGAAVAGEGAAAAAGFLGIPVIGWIAAGVIGTGLLVNYLSNLDASEIYESFGTAAKHLDNLDFKDGSPLYNLQQQIVAQLKSFEAKKQDVDISTDEGIAKSLRDLATAVAYVQQMDPKVKQLVQLSDDGKHWYSIEALSRDKGQALQHWNDMMKFCAQWQQEKKAELAKVNAAAGKPNAPGAETSKSNKAPGHKSTHYSLMTPQVKELQGLLSVEQDSKFGPNTFKALQEAAANNSLLNDLFKGNPKLEQGYQGWTNSDIGEALNRIKDGKASADAAQKPKGLPPLIPAPKESEVKNLYPEGYDIGWNAAKSQQR